MTTASPADRIDPVPAPYAVPADIAAASPMHNRVLVPAGRAADCVDVAADDRAAGLLHALRRPWERFQVTADVGLAGMVSAREFFAAIRSLADELLQPIAVGRRGLVVTDPSAADLVAGLYPDAVGDPDRLPGAAVSATRNNAPGPLRDKLVIIVGAGRSGTTWLEQLLLAHPRIGGVQHWESWIFEQLQPLWAVAERWPPGAVDRAIRHYCDAVLGATLVRHSPGADHVVEKTPMHSYRLNRIAAAYPDAWVVHLVRDGRDVAYSMSRVPFFGVPDVADAAAMWARVERAVRASRDGLGRYREVRYESLFADPVGAVGRLCGWIGLPFDDAVAQRVRDVAGDRVSAHAGTAGAVGPGGWQALPTADADRIYAAAGPILRRTGYAGPVDVLHRRLRARLRGPNNRSGSSA